MVNKLRTFIIFASFLLFSCDSSILEFNDGFAEGYKDGFNSRSCKELKIKKTSWRSKSFRDGYMKGAKDGVIDCKKNLEQVS